MNEIDEIQRLLKEGFLPAMILRAPAEDEIRRRLPDIHTKSQVRALPLRHPDGRKLMYYMKDPAAIKFAERLVAKEKSVIGYDLCVYCSGVGPETIRGQKLYLNDVVNGLRKSLNWDVSISDYPHTIEISFKIEGDDHAALKDRIKKVSEVALALSLSNRLGFVVSSTSLGTRYKGQPFSLKWGLQESNVHNFTSAQLTYIERIWTDQTALRAATALQDLYCQVSDNSRIAVGWAAIEDIFSTEATHLLTPDELTCLLKVVKELSSIPDEKRIRLKELLKDCGILSSKSRNERIAQRISDITGESFSDVSKKVRTLAKDRGCMLHTLSNHPKALKEHMAFVEKTLWARIENSVEGSNPFPR